MSWEKQCMLDALLKVIPWSCLWGKESKLHVPLVMVVCLIHLNNKMWVKEKILLHVGNNSFFHCFSNLLLLINPLDNNYLLEAPPLEFERQVGNLSSILNLLKEVLIENSIIYCLVGFLPFLLSFFPFNFFL